MNAIIDSPRLPVIDLSLFDAGDPWRNHLAAQVDWAGSTFGAFQLIGHGIDPGPGDTLVDLGRKFLGSQANEVDELSYGSRAPSWTDPRSRYNHYPDLPGFRDAVNDYLTAMTGLGHKLMTTIARGLGLHDGYFVDRYTGNPTTLLRVLSCRSLAGTGTRTDQRLLTFIRQDEAGGLQVASGGRWIEVPVAAGALVCCVGTVLRRMTDGHYVAVATRLSDRSVVPDGLLLTFSFDPSSAFLPEAIDREQTPASGAERRRGEAVRDRISIRHG